jgi:hypothetical protein
LRANLTNETIKRVGKTHLSKVSGKKRESSSDDEETDEDSREIAYLERKLGLEIDGKGSKTAAADGLDGK